MQKLPKQIGYPKTAQQSVAYLRIEGLVELPDRISELRDGVPFVAALEVLQVPLAELLEGNRSAAVSIDLLPETEYALFREIVPAPCS